MERIEVINNLAVAYCKVMALDRHLLKVEANERSIAHRFAIYIEQGFSDYHVDCDYNKNLEDSKRSPAYKHRTKKGKETDLVVPDIIVHKRNTNNHNLVVIELKPTAKHEDCTANANPPGDKCMSHRCVRKCF